jgi:hypothetical protein
MVDGRQDSRMEIGLPSILVLLLPPVLLDMLTFPVFLVLLVLLIWIVVLLILALLLLVRLKVVATARY